MFGLGSLFGGKKWLMLGTLFFLVKKFKTAIAVDFTPYVKAIKIWLLSWICLIVVGFTAWLTFMGGMIIWLHTLLNDWVLPFLIVFIFQLILLLICKLIAKKQVQDLQLLFKR